MIRKIKKAIIYFAGDIRREHCPLGFAWGRYDSSRLIDYDEALFSIFAPTSYLGFIGLHRNRGDLSNLAIKGFMKHAWGFDGSGGIVEAVSEGVLHRHPFHALMTDYAIILKPLVPEAAKNEAVDRWLSMVGCPYDDTFTFDLEIEASLFADKLTAVGNMQRYGLGVSCTEMVALGYVGHRRELGLYRTKLRSREVILPDAYLTTHFEIVWASCHTTVDTARKLGLHEEGCAMLDEYWQKQRR